jgi:hypothetical protein
MYLPFLSGPHDLTMGLKALDPADWIEPDGRLAEDLALRRRLLAERYDDVFGALPGSEPGQRETLELLLDHLPRRFPERYVVAGGRVRNRVTGEDFAADPPDMPPLELAGRLVQEDLCLMRPRRGGPAGGYVLAAAVLCFPSHWRLREKLGLPMRAIHAPVAGFAERLAGPADRFMAQLRPERPVMRLNWSLTDSPELFMPFRRRREGLTAANAGERLWLRVERQTLRRLPRSGDVLFTIRTHLTPLAEVAAVPGAAAALAARVEGLPPDLAAYKGLPPIRDALLGYLAAAAAAAGTPADAAEPAARRREPGGIA